MAGVYGNVLDAFPELFRQTKFWKADPLIGGGYGLPMNEEYYNVIVIDDTGDSLFRHKVASYLALDYENNDVLYTNDDTPIDTGMFLIHPDNGLVHRVVKQLDHSNTGGFSVWGIQRLQGDGPGRLETKKVDY